MYVFDIKKKEKEKEMTLRALKEQSNDDVVYRVGFLINYIPAQ